MNDSDNSHSAANNATKSNNRNKIDKSLLMKGRWALEEKEYAACITQHF